MRKPKNLIRALTATILLAFCAACQSAPAVRRKPAALETPASFLTEEDEVILSPDLWSDSLAFLQFVSGPAFRPDNCVSILTQVHDKLFNASSTFFDREIVEGYLDDIIQNIFSSRAKLHERLGDFARAGTLERDCTEAARGLNRSARFLEDYLGELKIKPAPSDPKHPEQAWTGAWPSVLVNPARPEAKTSFDIRSVLKSGDLLMSRGGAFTSAAIARLGDASSQFSHLSLVYIDDVTHAAFVIQAEIEIGVVATPLEDYLNDGNVRGVLYRYPDADLAARAAKAMYERVTRATASGANIPYNFSLDLSDEAELFCAQVVSSAFSAASSGGVVIPAYRSRLNHMEPRFLHSIGVTATESYLPGDTEVDPRLEFIAEWRDFSRTRQTRERDVLLDKMYDWINMRSYHLQSKVKSWIAEEVVFRVRRWPLFGRFLDKKFPLNMPKTTLGTIVLLDDVAEVLENHLEAAQLDYHDRTGLWMSHREMFDSLEDYRLRDSMSEAPELHKLFRPDP